VGCIAWGSGAWSRDGVRLLLETGADVDATEMNGLTALQVAAIIGQGTVARLLLEFGASIAAEDAFGWTALHRAARGGHMAVVQLLLEKGADIATETV
jgi:ankyrin repeat protein